MVVAGDSEECRGTAGEKKASVREEAVRVETEIAESGTEAARTQADEDANGKAKTGALHPANASPNV